MQLSRAFIIYLSLTNKVKVTSKVSLDWPHEVPDKTLRINIMRAAFRLFVCNVLPNLGRTPSILVGFSPGSIVIFISTIGSVLKSLMKERKMPAEPLGEKTRALGVKNLCNLDNWVGQIRTLKSCWTGQNAESHERNTAVLHRAKVEKPGCKR